MRARPWFVLLMGAACGASRGSAAIDAPAAEPPAGTPDAVDEPAVVDPSASKLALAAQKLVAGQWAIFKDADENAGSALSGTNSVNCDWMNKTDFWPGATPYHGRIAFHTSPANTETPWYTVIYDERTDTWERADGNLPLIAPGHAYDHNCVDPDDGKLYSAVYFDDTRILRFDLAAKTWLPDLAVASDLHMGQEPAYSLVWHRAPAGLVWLSGAGKIAFWDKATQGWTLVRGGVTVGEYHNVGAHNQRAALTIVGGGNDSSALYAVFHDGAKMVASAVSPPPPFGSFLIGYEGNDHGVLVAPHPSARTFIFLTMTGACWELDAGTAAAPSSTATWQTCTVP
ncbi:MAG TPA: hypothetical protein VFH73_04880, partial [Polyangia bacterium]|nr:hypothetical protein [Polyangia bacterium]